MKHCFAEEKTREVEENKGSEIREIIEGWWLGWDFKKIFMIPSKGGLQRLRWTRKAEENYGGNLRAC